MPVAVVTDTTHYMPREVVERYGLHQVSLYVNWQGRQDREADLPDFDAFYEYLRSAQTLPTTSQPSVGDFLAVYEPLIEAGEDILSIHLAAGISGTCRAAEQARDQLVERGVDPARIIVLDSTSACGAMGTVLITAANAARAGAGVAEAADAARAVAAEARIWFAVDTLEYLRRGGRIGAAQAWLGTTLKIKPILTLQDQITPIERVRTSSRAVARLVEFLQTRHDDGCDTWYVQHIQDPDRAQVLVDRGREIFRTDPGFVSEIGPVIGTHVGPGLLGVSAVPGRLMG